MEDVKEAHKSHKKAKTGARAGKTKKKSKHDKHQQNPKAFSIQSVDKTMRKVHHVLDLHTKKRHIPIVNRTPDEPPPIVVAIVGPPKVGKSTLMQCIIKNYTRQKITHIQGPVTVVAGKHRRITLMECQNDINSMIDIAKIADLVLLLVDATFGFEMEIFEFLNICQVHGFPRVMGILTHLDSYKDGKILRRRKKRLKHRFWTEIYKGAKLFYLSGMVHGDYQKTEIHNLCRFISVMKFRPMEWRLTHPYILADRMEDITHQNLVDKDDKCDRIVSLYGYLRGTLLKNGSPVHIPGCGDFHLHNIECISDPCPTPDREKKEKRRSLDVKDRLMYAPMSGVGGIVYDRDAVYIDIGTGQSTNAQQTESSNELLADMLQMKTSLDQRMIDSQVTVFSGNKPVTSQDVEDEKEDENREDDSSEEDDEEEKNDDEKMDKSTADDGHLSFDESDEMDDDDDEIMEYPTSVVVDEKKNIKKHQTADDTMKWKSNLAEKAAELFRERQQQRKNYMKIVYGQDESLEDRMNEEDEVGGLFHILKKRNDDENVSRSAKDGLDCSRISSNENFNLDDLKESIKDVFVTGKWDESEDAETLLKKDDEVYGDFEDLESGLKYSGVEDEDDKEDNEDELHDSNDPPTVPENKVRSIKTTVLERRLAKKRKLKERFDNEYDSMGDSKFYDEWKADTESQAKMNKQEFEGLPDDLRINYEGHRPGMYVRLEIHKVPCEMVTNFNPLYPLIIGGLQSQERNIGYVQTRFKKHRWYKKILKTRNPLIISLGWRRFQTIPLFSIQEHNKRQRLLKYTPEHMHCHATFWGPLTTQGAGVLAVQSVSTATPEFRVAATGVVLELDKSMQIVKKLKLTGEPIKVQTKTAYIKGMFTSALEVAKFQGAAIRSVSGLRGQIKKAVSDPPGAFRATFEDRIRLNDIVFVRTWYPVDIPKFYNPVVSNLLPNELKSRWEGMKTIGQLRHEKGITMPVDPNSLYRKIERAPIPRQPLVIPQKLQKELPFKTTPKNLARKKVEEPYNRVAVIRDVHESKVAKLVKMVSEIHRHKKAVRAEADRVRARKSEKLREKIELGKAKKHKERKKEIFRALGKLEKRQNKNKDS